MGTMGTFYLFDSHLMMMIRAHFIFHSLSAAVRSAFISLLPLTTLPRRFSQKARRYSKLPDC